MALTARIKEIRKKKHTELELRDLLHGFRDISKNLKLSTRGYTRKHDLEQLMAGLQGAVTLEFATLPPYLSAIWSIKDDLHPVARSLREILQEEMLHMALACNMLVSVGGRPLIKTAVPSYPGKLPLNVHPELTVHLSGLTDEALKTFLEIERPKHPGHFASLEAQEEIQAESMHEGDDDLTIGELYDEILAAFRRLDPEITTDRQITGPLAWFVVKNLDDVERAIRTIETQGEGSEGDPDSCPGDLAHYYRFAEMLERKKLVKDPKTGEWSFKTPIDFDMKRDVWPVGKVPANGYTDDIVPDPEVRRLLRGFNVTYSKLLDLLDTVWSTDGGQAAFWHAIETMFALENFGRPLMQMERPEGGNYGPDFRYIPPERR